MTATVLVIVLVTKFLAGAWIAIVAMIAIFLLMRGIGRHYDRVSEELEIDDSDVTLPSRVHAIVLVSKLHKPTMRALAYARVSRPNSLEALTVEFDPARDRGADEAVGGPRDPDPAQGRQLALPRAGATRDPLRQGAPQVEPPRHHHGLHPRVRRREVVGAAAAQPDRPAAQGPSAVHARRHGHERALPAQLRGPRQEAPRSRIVRHRATSAADSGTARHVRRPDRRRRPHRPRRPLRRPTRRPGRVRPPHAARRARTHPHHRPFHVVPARRRRRGHRGRTRPGRGAVPVRRTRPVRRLRLPARRSGDAARAAGRRRT